MTDRFSGVHRYEVLVHPGVDRLYGPAADAIMRTEVRAAVSYTHLTLPTILRV